MNASLLPAPRSTWMLLLAAVLSIGVLSACQTTEDAIDEAGDALDDDDDMLMVDLQDTGADGTVMGEVRFFRDGNRLRASGSVQGLSEGPHGFHVHENGSCDMQDGTPAGAAGGHFNPGGSPHGPPTAPPSERHVGDFGNIQAGSDGMADVDAERSMSRSDYDLDDMEGKAVIIHSRRDDLETQPSGNAGARVACGILN